MVPTEEAMMTRQMLYSALPVPATAAFAINFLHYAQLHCSGLARIPSVSGTTGVEHKTQPRTLPPAPKAHKSRVRIRTQRLPRPHENLSFAPPGLIPFPLL